jgi:hypothetical protein
VDIGTSIAYKNFQEKEKMLPYETRTYSRWPALILSFLFLANIFDPGNVLHLKYAAFAVAAMFAMLGIAHLDLTIPQLICGTSIFMLWPLVALLNGIARGAPVPISISQVTPFLAVPLMALLLFHIEPERGLRLLFNCLAVLAGATLLLFCAQLFWPDNPISQYLASQGQAFGFFGAKPDWDVPNVYFGATLFLVPAFVYFLWSKKFWRALLCMVGLTLSFSKAGILIALTFLSIYIIRELRHPARIRWKKLFVWSPAWIGLLLIAINYFPLFAYDIEDALSGQSQTTRVRVEYLKDFIAYSDRHPIDLLFGEGTGPASYRSSEISEGRNKYNLELDHINMIRKFGLVWFVMFSATVGMICIKLKSIPAASLALLSIFVAAGTNPVLESPLFFMLLTICYFFSERLSNSESRQQE